MEQLPEYMKICYMALYNTNNEIGYKILKRHRRNAIPHLKRTVIFSLFLSFFGVWVYCFLVY